MSYQSTILEDSPVLYYELEEASGTTAADDSGNGSDGTYTATGVTYRVAGPVAAETSYGVTLDGDTGTLTYTTITGAAKPTYPFCLEAWVKPVSLAANEVVVSIYDSDRQDIAWIRAGTSGAVWKVSVDNGAQSDDQSGGTVSVGQWQHLFARFVSATERHLYVNAVLVASGTDSVAWSDPGDYALSVGSNGGLNGFANTSVSRVAYYNADVSELRIGTHYDAGIPYYGIDGDIEYGPWLGGSIEHGAWLTGTLEYGPPR